MDLQKELSLKAEILTEGVRATGDALQGLGTDFKEQLHGLFGWDFDNHPGQLLPDDFRLPGGTVVQFRYKESSPYLVVRNGQGLSLTNNGEHLCGVEWLPRPRFYDMLTSDGVPMTKVAQVGGEDSFFVCYNNYCSHWHDGKQCLFCNLVTTKRTYKSVLTRKKVEQIGEAAGAAFAEGQVKHILMTGGCFIGEDETAMATTILDSIKRHTGMEKIPGCVLSSPPEKPGDIERLYEAGITGIGYSLEICDRDLFRAICPGKHEKPGYDGIIQALEQAVEVFGRGRVFCALVTGIEPQDSLLRGVEYLASRGIYSLCFVWSPAPGSRLEGHRAPTSRWYRDTTSKVVDLFEKYNLPPNNDHCHRCDGNTLFHDELRLRKDQIMTTS